MLEFEVKAVLTPSEYFFLKTRRFPFGKTELQRNYYYDTEDYELNGKGITCRIREKDGTYTATVKDHSLFGCNVETSKPACDRWDSSFFDGMGISFQGELTTVRTSVHAGAEFSAFLDENRYLGTVDYELEYEYDPEKQDALIREIYELSLDLEFHGVVASAEEFRSRFVGGKSKSERFFQRKQKNLPTEEPSSFLADV